MKSLKLVTLLWILLMQASAFAQDTLFVRNEQVIPAKANSIESICKSIAGSGHSFPVSRDKSSNMKSVLEDIVLSGNTIFYKIRLNNRSNSSYDIDFIRFYVRDLKRAKRTVSQEQEIHPVYSCGWAIPAIDRKERSTLVFAFNKFPIVRDQALFVEVYEKNGGRHLYLKVSQADIRNARLIN